MKCTKVVTIRQLRCGRRPPRLHLTLDFQLNSQPLAACLTRVPTIGGRAWPSFQLHDPRWEELVTLWSNSTLGMMRFWWTGSRQQQGRSVLTISALPSLHTVDPRPPE